MRASTPAGGTSPGPPSQPASAAAPLAIHASAWDAGPGWSTAVMPAPYRGRPAGQSDLAFSHDATPGAAVSG